MYADLLGSVIACVATSRLVVHPNVSAAVRTYSLVSYRSQPACGQRLAGQVVTCLISIRRSLTLQTRRDYPIPGRSRCSPTNTVC
jgi:hypothetical protein